MRDFRRFLILAWTALAGVHGLGAAEAPTPLQQKQLLALLEIEKIYVDPLNGAGSEPLRDLLIGSLQRTGLFAIVENEERADAYLRGAAEDLVYSDYYRSREGLNVRGSGSASEKESGESQYFSGSFGIGDTEAFSRRERKHDAMAAVRLVLRNGDVIWSTTQESAGAKYKGAAADVADKVAKELAEAFRWALKIRKKAESPPVFPSPGKL